MLYISLFKGRLASTNQVKLMFLRGSSKISHNQRKIPPKVINWRSEVGDDFKKKNQLKICFLSSRKQNTKLTRKQNQKNIPKTTTTDQKKTKRTFSHLWSFFTETKFCKTDVLQCHLTRRCDII